MLEDNKPSGPHSFTFTHWEYLEPLQKHLSFIVVFVLSAALTALALTYVYSEKYQATTTIIFSPEEVTRLKIKTQETEAFGAPMPSADFKVIGRTLDELARSERLLREVVAKLNLDVVEEKVYTGPWYIRYYEMAEDYGKEYALKAWSFMKYGRIPETDPTVEAVLNLAAEIEVTNQDSYVFFLTVRDKHPRRVAAIADTLAQGLVDILEEDDLGPTNDRVGQLKTLLGDKGTEIQGYQDEIRTLLGENKMASVSQELDQGLAQLYGLLGERTELEAQIEQSKQKIAALDVKLGLKGGAIAGSKIDTRQNSAVNSNATAQAGRSKGTEKLRIQPDDFKQMASDKLFTEIELDGLRARYASLQASITGLEAWLRELPSLRLQIDQLQTDLDRANGEYELLSVALQELEVRQVDALSELKIQHAATVPTAPVTPIKVYHVGLAAGLGLCVAIGLVYVFGYFNIRVFMASRGVRGRAKLSAAIHRGPGGPGEQVKA